MVIPNQKIKKTDHINLITSCRTRSDLACYVTTNKLISSKYKFELVLHILIRRLLSEKFIP